VPDESSAWEAEAIRATTRVIDCSRSSCRGFPPGACCLLLPQRAEGLDHSNGQEVHLRAFLEADARSRTGDPFITSRAETGQTPVFTGNSTLSVALSCAQICAVRDISRDTFGVRASASLDPPQHLPEFSANISHLSERRL
jgi:hypothetical protein